MDRSEPIDPACDVQYHAGIVRSLRPHRQAGEAALPAPFVHSGGPQIPNHKRYADPHPRDRFILQSRALFSLSSKPQSSFTYFIMVLLFDSAFKEWIVVVYMDELPSLLYDTYNVMSGNSSQEFVEHDQQVASRRDGDHSNQEQIAYRFAIEYLQNQIARTIQQENGQEVDPRAIGGFIHPPSLMLSPGRKRPRGSRADPLHHAELSNGARAAVLAGRG